ncbi:MAG TPA: lysophospholipid acyltransferase family protein, partial [Candidatus Polarisedimenticolia bacterium]|nr:lysophospholipid acyltransferase family protein [Candidatus Polarisedimenticolia bacterium]
RKALPARRTPLTPLGIVLIVLYTLVLGSIGILLCLLIPGGAALMPLARLWSWLVLKTWGVEWRATFDPGLDASRPSIYVANHQSLLDIPALALAMPTDFRMVAKRELLLIPIFGWALWLAGFVFVDRADREKAIRTLDRAVRKIHRGTSIVVFAEGTRSPDGCLLPFKKGGFVLALQAGVPIVPVSIRGGHAVLPKGSLRVRPGCIEIHFREPIETTRYTLDTRNLLIEEARRRIAAGLLPDPPPGPSR